METFHITVLTIAAAVLILILTIVGVTINASNKGIEWPPTAGRCPNEWEEDTSTLGKCYNPIGKWGGGTVSLATPNATYSNVALTFVGNRSNKLFGTNNAWHHAGDAIIRNNTTNGNYPYENDGAILTAKTGSNFNYFKTDDIILLELGATKIFQSRTNSRGVYIPEYRKLFYEYQLFKVKSTIKDGSGNYTVLKLKRDTVNGASYGGTSELKPVINKTTADVADDYTVSYEATNSEVKYFGLRIGIDFANDATGVYKGTDMKSTKCLRKAWANANEIRWDGISNYNKCG